MHDGTIWTVVAVGTGAAFVPVVLDVDVAPGSTTESIMALLSNGGPLIGLAFVVVCFALLIALFTGGGDF